MKLAIAKIVYDGGTQPRYSIDDELVTKYREEMEAGAKFPPVVVFHDGKSYYLADGFHRLFAAEELKRTSIDCDVKKGSLRDAILYSCGANATHGLPRTNLDKRQAVETLLRDEEWAQWSDNKIAKACAVSQQFVSKLRTSLTTVVSDRARYITKHGTEATMDTRHIGRKRDYESDPERYTVRPMESERSATGDLPGVRRLKHAWQIATKKEQQMFKKWLVKQ